MKSIPLVPIANSLIRRVFKWVILCIILFSSLQAWLNYRAIEKNFQMTVTDVANTHIPLLSVALWDIEPQTVQKQIVLLLKNTPISYVIIKASTGQQFVGGDASQLARGDHLLLQIPAPAEIGGNIGTLELVINRDILHQELLRSFLLVTVEILVLTVFILFAVATILRRDLEKPMRQLAEFVKNLHANQIASKLDIERPPEQAYNEIDLVIDGFRKMQNSIQEHILHQDALVNERTLQLEQAMQTLKKLSITDGLTACYNRLLFNERMPAEIQRANRYERALSLVFCDIDYFKSVNDRYGHSVGDQVLIAFAECLNKELRAEIDWVVRYGGEEFIVVLPETNLSEAVDAAERMRDSVERQLELQLPDGNRLRITASFGVAQKEDNDTVESLVHRADDRLYFAKANGRNQVQPQKK